MEWSRIISGLLAAGYTVAAHLLWENGGWFFLATYLVLPLGAIWFGREIGDFATLTSSDAEPDPLPGLFVILIGWLLMLPPLAALFIYS